MRMRSWLKLLLLVVGLGVYGLQAASAQHHVHGLHGKTPCSACLLHESPSVAPPLAATVARPAPTRSERLPPAPDETPKPQLAPSDVSFATSPPSPRRPA